MRAPPPLRLAVQVVGMVVLVALFARLVDWASVARALGRPAALPWMAAAAGVWAIGQAAHSTGWRILLRANGVHVGLVDAVRHDLSSVFWSTVLPGGVAGELVKGVRLTREGARAGDVGVALVATRLVSGMVCAGLALVMLPLSHFDGPLRAFAGVALGGTVAAGVLGLGVLRAGRAIVARHLPAVAARLPVGAFPPAPAMAGCALAAIVTHLAFGAVYCLCFGAAGHAAAYPDGAVIYALTSVAMLLPVSVGGYGVRELTVVHLGEAIAPGVAAAAAVALAALFTGAVGLGGLVELRRLAAAAAIRARSPS